MKTTEHIAHLWPGQLGNGFLVLSFVAALVSLVAYFLSSKDQAYLKMARAAFHAHSFAVVGIAGVLFFMLFNHYYEYEYVWHHSNNAMPMRYILSCFWEGQEGSFLLWTFWNVVLGLLLKRMLNGNQWEAPVMTVFALVQVFLASMLLGIFLGDYRIGSNPFLLLRDHPDMVNAPFVQSGNIPADGRGLNPLLMNYWMTIHPPTLFLGFASTLPPFAFALAGLWKRQYNSWQQVALPWTFFGILILGVGILMGGAWAYEALSFGGFWAWDPVENSSLVPWLVLVGAGHVMIVNKNRGGSLFTTHLMAIGSFLLVLYSTFLTRSGILGQSSVHAFTDLGMQGQLVLYVLTFVLLCVAFLIDNMLIRVSYVMGSVFLAYFSVLYGHQKLALMLWTVCSLGLCVYGYTNYFPKEEEEEEFYSREFWIFLGALFLLLSSLIITYFTSIPVLNKLFNLKKAPLEIRDYNLWIVPFVILTIVLIAGAQFLKFRHNDKKIFFRQLRNSFLLSVLFGSVCCAPLYFIKGFSESTGEHKWELVSYSLLFIASFFAVIANGDYWLRILKGKVMKAGASIAHLGFALLMIGALVSTSKKTVLSKDTSNKKVESLGKEFDSQTSILLTQGDTLPMGPYLVTYTGRRREGINVFFKVDYFVKGKNGQPEFAFQLQPKMQEHPVMGRAPDPDTKHYVDRDVYTHVKAYPDFDDENIEKNKDKYNEPGNYVRHISDTIFASNAIVIIDSLRTNLNEQQYQKNDSLLIVTAVLKALDINGRVYRAYPKYIIRKNMIEPQDAEVKELGLKFTFWKIDPESGSIEITMSEKVKNSRDFIVMEAAMFPYINVLWLGCLTMALGTGIAIVERVRKLKLSNSKQREG